MDKLAISWQNFTRVGFLRISL